MDDRGEVLKGSISICNDMLNIPAKMWILSELPGPTDLLYSYHITL